MVGKAPTETMHLTLLGETSATSGGTSSSKNTIDNGRG